MATAWANVDSNFPVIGGDENIPEQLRAVNNYMYALTEELKYTLDNLDESNLNNTFLEDFTAGITAQIDAASTKAKNALDQIRSLESGTDAELTKLSELLEGLSEEVKGLIAKCNMITQDEETMTLGGEGKTINLNGTVFVNGRKIS